MDCRCFSLILQAVALLLLEKPYTLQELLVKALHIQILVHLFAAAFQTSSVFWPRFCPTLLWCALRQPSTKPGDGGLVQQKILHAAWLTYSRIPHESMQPVVSKCLFVFRRNGAAVWKIKPATPVGEKNVWL